jgi:hypothetical protein
LPNPLPFKEGEQDAAALFAFDALDSEVRVAVVYDAVGLMAIGFAEDSAGHGKL